MAVCGFAEQMLLALESESRQDSVRARSRIPPEGSDRATEKKRKTAVAPMQLASCETLANKDTDFFVCMAKTDWHDAFTVRSIVETMEHPSAMRRLR